MATDHGPETPGSTTVPEDTGNEAPMERLRPFMTDGPTDTAHLSTLRKERMTVTLPVPLLERLRNTVFWKPELTIAGLIEEGLVNILARLERENGGPYPKRMSKLKGGRRKHVRHTH